MPPEGFDGKRSVQTDVWSVGVNLYQFLTGALPFPSKEPSALITAIMLREFEPLPPDVPQNLQNVIAKALAKQTESRYSSAGAMREDLRRVLRGEAVAAFIQSDSRQTFPAEQIPPTQKSVPFSAQNSQDENETIVRSTFSFGQNEKRKISNVWMYATLGLFLVGATGLGIYSLTNQSKQDGSYKNEVARLKTQASNNDSNSENVNVATKTNIETPTPIPTPDKVQLQTVINKYLSGVAKVNEFQEYKESRKIFYGDLDNDGDDDAAVLSVMSFKAGGNSTTQVLAVFKNDAGTFSAITGTQVGGRLYRDAKFKSIRNGRIYFEIMTYDSDKDAACCPSIKGKTSFALIGDKLVEK